MSQLKGLPGMIARCFGFFSGVEFNGDVRWASKEAEHREI
jgi:hypothetical protein